MKKTIFLLLFLCVMLNTNAQPASMYNTNRTTYKIGDTIQLVGNNIRSLKLKSIARQDSFFVTNFISKVINNNDQTYSFIVPNTVKNEVYLINAYSIDRDQLSDSIRLVRFFVVPTGRAIDSFGFVDWGPNSGWGQNVIPELITNVVQVVASYYYRFALKGDGTVVNGRFPADLNNVVQVAGGFIGHSLALKADGTVVTGGDNTYQQTYTKPADLNNVVQIAAGAYSSFALKADGRVVAWGPPVSYDANKYGATTVPAGLKNVVQVVAGSQHVLALKADGTVVAWGDNSVGQTAETSIIPSSFTNLVQVAAGDYHSLALKADGTVVTWGYKQGGITTIPLGLNNVVQVAGGSSHSLALKGDGTVVAWGDSYNISQGQTTIPAGLTAVEQVAAAGTYSVAIYKFSVKTISNLGGTITPTTFVKYGDNLHITYKPNSGFFVDSVFINGVLNRDSLEGYSFTNLTYKTVRVVFKPYGAPSKPRTLTGYGRNRKAYLSFEEPANYGFGGRSIVKYIAQVVGSTIKDSSSTNAIIIKGLTNGQPYNISVAAVNNQGIISDTILITNIIPILVTEILSTNRTSYKIGDTLQLRGHNIKTLTLKSFATKDSFMVTNFISKLINNGDTIYNFIVPNTVKNDVYLINAYNYRTQLSDSIRLVRFIPTNIDSLGVVGWGWDIYGITNIPDTLKNVVQVAGGLYHSIALKADGSVFAWGDNSQGQTRIPAGLTNVVQIAAGLKHSIALKVDGRVVAWGDNNGIGQTSMPAGLNNVVQIAAGSNHRLALKVNGTVVAWGDTTYKKTIIPAGLNNVVQIAAGANHSLALKRDSTLVAWGDTTYKQTNIPAGLNNVIQVAAGSNHSIALKRDSTVFAWGDYDNGQTSIPASLNNVVQVATGSNHNLALKRDSTVVAWGGDNNSGQTTIPTGLTHVVQVAAGSDHNLAIHKLFVKTTTNLNGTITPTTFVKNGDSLRITYKGIKGYFIDSLFINDALVKDSLIGYTFKNINQFKNIQIKFKQVNKPLKPQNVIGIGGKNKVTINYLPPADNGGAPIAKYIFQVLNTNIKDSQLNNPITINNLQNNQPYTISIKAVNAADLESDTVLIQVTPINQFSINTNVINGYISPTIIIDTASNYRITYSALSNNFSLDSIYINGVYNMFATRDSINSYTFKNVRNDSSIKVIYKIKTFTISASARNNGSITPQGDTIVNYGATPTYTFTPNTGYIIDSVILNGRKIETGNRYQFDSVKLNQIISVTFKLQNGRTITLTSNPANGGTTSGAGNYDSGSTVSVTATPNSGYIFTNWTENGIVVNSNARYTFTINANRNLVANFTQQAGINYSVALTSNPANGGTTSGAGNYKTDTTISVTATPNSGYIFTNWTENGTVVSSNARYTFTINANRNLVANFTQQSGINYSVSLTSNPANGGTTSGVGNYTSGSTVSITATPNSGYVFTNWTENGTVVSSNASYTFTINANRNLVANFTQQSGINYSVSLTSNPANGGTTSGVGNYTSGSTVSVTATPNSGYVFTNWTENGTVVSSNASYTFTINANRNLFANFTCSNLETPMIVRVNNTLETNLKTYSKYEWYKDNSILNGNITYLIQSPSIGVYSVKGFNQNLCATSLSNKYYYSPTCITPAGRLGNGAAIQANMVANSNQIIIKWCPDILKNILTIQVVDFNGNKVLEEKVAANLGTYILYKNTINANQYFIQILDENNEVVQLSDLVNKK